MGTPEILYKNHSISETILISKKGIIIVLFVFTNKYAEVVSNNIS